MKLPKLLLGAVLVGITMQTVTSCKKDKLTTEQAEKKKKEEEFKKRFPDGCPACGMG